MKKEVVPHWNLTVKVLRGKFHTSQDYFSQSDLFVTLHLPTASARTPSTKCISNNNMPEWNETFHFQVPSQLKNILELNVYDQDLLYSSLCTSILFDISNLTLGKKETKVFITDDKTKDELWVEFEITKSPEEPGKYVTNGVLMAAPLTTLDVKLDKLPPTKGIQDMMLYLRGAYKEDQVISFPKNENLLPTLRYYINKNLETEIRLSQDSTKDVSAQASDQGVLFAPRKERTLSLPVAEHKVNLSLKATDRSEKDLSVRLDFDIPEAEKVFLIKRKAVVSRALQKALNLKNAPDPSRVPTVAAVFSGGGTRAMTATLGSLRGLQKLGLLDTVSYITALSGSTWALSCLYSDPDWSVKGMDETMLSVQKELSKSVSSLFSLRMLQYYMKELEQREKEGHPVSLIDMWGLALEQLIFGKNYTGTLSDQKRAVSQGQNPLPIYTAINTKEDASGCIVPEWCEFTPFEVGFHKYGAFVPTENFGSEYYIGHLIQKLPETRISFLLGIWSSIFSVNLTELWSTITGMIPCWIPWIGKSVSSIEKDHNPSTLDTLRVSPEASFLSSFMNSRPVISKAFNFMRGFFLSNNYSENSSFTAYTHPDAFPNKLTPMDPTLGLVDPGFEVNSGFPPVLRSHRHVDVILSLNYSWEPDQFKVLKQMQQYCTDHKMVFPQIDLDKVALKPLKEVYVFEDEDNPAAPIVIHFPMVNISFREYKAPGVRRQGEKELKEGDVVVDVNASSSPYVTNNLTYAPTDFQRLTELTSYNILNNRDTITQVLQKALNRRAPEERNKVRT